MIEIEKDDDSVLIEYLSMSSVPTRFPDSLGDYEIMYLKYIMKIDLDDLIDSIKNRKFTLNEKNN